MLKSIIVLSLFLVGIFESNDADSKPDIFIPSDFSGQAGPDDRQSCIRFLLNTKELDIEGIIVIGSK
ncbi:MAG: hypothetical protein HC819_22940 [Cyclobacteriaceae bacterium]|nr:hypothetical protein [Cyclobacteriaceae bacterium]